MTRSVIRVTVSFLAVAPGGTSREAGEDVGKMRRDVRGGQAFGIEGQHHLVDVGQAPLPLLHQLRLEGAVPVLRDVDLHLAGGVGRTVLDLVPLREFPRLRPAESCLS